MRPFLKWVGGKRQLIPELIKYVPENFNRYFEPFVGAGALLFHIQPSYAIISDMNWELINCYCTIRDNVDELIVSLAKHENNKEYFYSIRSIDRKEEYKTLSNVEKASRIMFMNKTCFNGLYRVNKKGYFNAPFGDYHNPRILDEVNLRSVSEYLNNLIDIKCEDFESCVRDAGKGDFIYFDPPYHPLSSTASFTDYTESGFTIQDQLRLKRIFDMLNYKGCKVVMSNSATPLIFELYEKYNVHIVSAKRSINSNGALRKGIDEVIISN